MFILRFQIHTVARFTAEIKLKLVVIWLILCTFKSGTIDPCITIHYLQHESTTRLYCTAIHPDSTHTAITLLILVYLVWFMVLLSPLLSSQVTSYGIYSIYLPSFPDKMTLWTRSKQPINTVLRTMIIFTCSKYSPTNEVARHKHATSLQTMTHTYTYSRQPATSSSIAIP